MKRFFALILCSFCLFPGAVSAEKTVQTGEFQVFAEKKQNAGTSILLTRKEISGIKSSGEKEEPADDFWMKVIFRRTLEVWVASCFINNNVFTDQVIFRMTPTSASIRLQTGESFAGKKAVILAESGKGYWKRVRVTGLFTGYIRRQDLAPAKQKITAKTNLSHPVMISADGKLIPLEKKVEDATHKVIFTVNQQVYVVAYIIPDKTNLRLWENRSVHISGTGFWKSGIYTPFLRVEKIMPLWR